jgi:hypothetical protein
MFIKPVLGRLVRDPVTKTHLPPEGREVSDHDLFWRRRLDDGDVVVVSAPLSAPSPQEG